MQILIVATEAFGGWGGIAKYNSDLLEALSTYPEITKILALARLGKPDHTKIPPKIDFWCDSSYSVTTFVKNLLKTGIRPEIGLVLCGHIHLLPLVYPIARWHRVPLLLFIHGIEAWTPSRRTFCNFLAPKVDGVVSVSEFTARKFCAWTKLNRGKVDILPNAIRLENYGPGEKSPVLLKRYQIENKHILMTLGRLSSDERYKGIDEVLDIFPLLLKMEPSLFYLVIGDGSDRARLESKAKRLGLSQVVRFIGSISENEKADHYRLADAFVMPGHGEGFGIVYLEALASGIPVVASKLDGSQEAVRGGKLGTLVDPFNSEELIQGILAALNSSKRGRVPEDLRYFSYENFENRCHGLLDKILKHHKEEKRAA